MENLLTRLTFKVFIIKNKLKIQKRETRFFH